jgi:riboflavin kinase/FMN adenylyltransferase
VQSEHTGGRLVVVGNFDGVHLGHQRVLGAAARRARELALEPIALTFFPHPAEVLTRRTPALLTTLERRAELVARVDPALRLVVERFDESLAAQSPDQFAESLLADKLGARVVLVGENFRFGRDRQGDLEVLKALGARLGFVADSEPLAGDATGAFSSTRIRKTVESGDVHGAARMLGRPHSLSGKVARGDGRGRLLGFKTANLADVSEARPENGVYACAVDRRGPDGYVRQGVGVVNIGVRPTFEAGPSIEVHLLDFDADLYDDVLRVHLLARIRAEIRFEGAEALKQQISLDVERARSLTGRVAPDPAAGAAWF